MQDVSSGKGNTDFSIIYLSAIVKIFSKKKEKHPYLGVSQSIPGDLLHASLLPMKIWVKGAWGMKEVGLWGAMCSQFGQKLAREGWGSTD